MLAWLGGSKRRRLHSNQSTKKKINRGNSGRWQGSSGAAAAGGDLAERWTASDSLPDATICPGNTCFAAATIDMFALTALTATGSVAIARASRQPPPTLCGEPLTGQLPAPLRPAPRHVPAAAATAAGAATTRLHRGELLAYLDSDRDKCNRHPGASEKGNQLSFEEYKDDQEPSGAAEKFPVCADAAEFGDDDGGNGEDAGLALQRGFGRGAADGADGSSNSQFSSSACAFGSVQGAAAARVMEGAVAVGRRGFGNDASRVQQRSAPQNLLPGRAVSGQVAADRGARGSGGVRAASLDLLWLGGAYS